MTAPPLDFEKVFHDGMVKVREALAQAPDAAREEVKQVLDSDELVQRVVNIVVPVMDQRFRKKYYRNLIFGIGIILTIFAVAISCSFSSIAKVAAVNAATNTDQDAAIQRSEQTITAFREQLDQANAKLISQGLPPVNAPQDPAPGTAGQAELINAAATATTLASLPKEVFVDPDPATIAAAVVTYMTDHPVVVDPQLVINAVADYFAANQEKLRGPQGQTGEQGPQGPPGPPPTAEQIQAAFRTEIQNNPQLLCPMGGTYTQKALATPGNGSVVSYGCYGAEDSGTGGDGGGGGDGSGDTQESPGNTGGGDAAVPSPSTGGTTTSPQTSAGPTTTTSAPTTTSDDPAVLDDLLGVP